MKLAPADIVMYSKLQCLLKDWLDEEAFPPKHFGAELQKKGLTNSAAIQLTRVVIASFNSMENVYLDFSE